MTDYQISMVTIVLSSVLLGVLGGVVIRKLLKMFTDMLAHETDDINIRNHK